MAPKKSRAGAEKAKASYGTPGPALKPVTHNCPTMPPPLLLHPSRQASRLTIPSVDTCSDARMYQRSTFEKENSELYAAIKLRAPASGKISASFAIAGLFAGIAGFEQGFRQLGHFPILLSETDSSARRVLQHHFPAVPLHGDIRELRRLPSCDVVTAGFPCQDLSQVGRVKGIAGSHSSLIAEVFRLLESADERVKWLVLENVPFMLRLHEGQAIDSITKTLTGLGWKWAYRTIDARAFGPPQRRRRVILLASREFDPRPVLLASDAGESDLLVRRNSACGFYWTEGHRGLGWAKNGIPPLKGGSGLAIPSPPAIWFPGRRLIALPSLEDAERLQGFSAGWTRPAAIDSMTNRQRWRLVGNAVSVPLAKWIAERLITNDSYDATADIELNEDEAWPDAAWGLDGCVVSSNASAWPVKSKPSHLASYLEHSTYPLSHKAAAGFLARLDHSGLRCDARFVKDLRRHVGKTRVKKNRVDLNVSKRMSATRGRDNPAELALRSALHAKGYRFRVHYKAVKGLRRVADIAFPSLRTLIFLDGCFWHGCPVHGTWPKTNAKFWRAKIVANRRRDRNTDKELKAAGWQVIRIWEHEDSSVVLKRLVHALRARGVRRFHMKKF
jgi:DNA (cytosine-5)-methyltransferase 1